MFGVEPGVEVLNYTIFVLQLYFQTYHVPLPPQSTLLAQPHASPASISTTISPSTSPALASHAGSALALAFRTLAPPPILNIGTPAARHADRGFVNFGSLATEGSFKENGSVTAVPSLTPVLRAKISTPSGVYGDVKRIINPGLSIEAEAADSARANHWALISHKSPVHMGPTNELISAQSARLFVEQSGLSETDETSGDGVENDDDSDEGDDQIRSFAIMPTVLSPR